MFGIGFCRGGAGAESVNEKGVLGEPGSSWLASLSMTGMCGLFGFLALITPLIKTLLRMAIKRTETFPAFFEYISPLWLVLMTFEGFAHYVGNPFCFLAILNCGILAESVRDRTGLRVEFNLLEARKSKVNQPRTRYH